MSTKATVSVFELTGVNTKLLRIVFTSVPKWIAHD